MLPRGFDLDGKAIVITGASSGIGRAAALVMGGLGARLLLAARDVAALDAVAGQIRDQGGTAATIRTDVGVKADTLAMLDQAEALYGPVDGLFANAGMGGPAGPLGDYDDDAFDRVMTVNVKSLFWAMKRLLPQMSARQSGSILATGSLASERGLPMTSAYNASKHAVLGLVRSAASEVARHGVRVNAILPGLIETRMLSDLAGEMTGGDTQAGLTAMSHMVPMGRVGTADELGRVAAFMLSDAASYVNGQAWAVDGGMLTTIGASS